MTTIRVSFAGSLLCLSACAAAAPAPPAAQVQSRQRLPPATTPPATSLPQLLLERHNAERRAAGVPPLMWDAKLAAGATEHARSLSQTGQLVHSPRASRPRVGENLWVGTARAYGADAGVTAWVQEKSDYRDGVFPNVSRTGNWLDVSHYTQMIWRTTTHVGCAVARSGRWDALVCRYSPNGNRDGQQPR